MVENLITGGNKKKIKEKIFHFKRVGLVKSYVISSYNALHNSFKYKIFHCFFTVGEGVNYGFTKSLVLVMAALITHNAKCSPSWSSNSKQLLIKLSS
jgi:hypothetical protein